jgi:hypothetical protein
MLGMPVRSSKKPSDTNRLAAAIVAQATGEPVPKPALKKKNAAAVALGRLGGKVGGKARAEKLSDERKREIAQGAAAARWGKKSSE